MFDGARPGELVETAPPRVTLRNAFAHPFDSAIAAARTCYAPRLISPEEITDKQRLNIGAATFFSGHHTVYQHAHFEFGLENVSRQFVWSFLHAHPFYNSEQQSQRYVRLDRAQAFIPPRSESFGAEESRIYERAVARAWERYRELTVLLQADARAILADIWHLSSMSHPRRIDKVERQAEKRAIEVARYVLPVAAATTMVHTLSGVVLHRLWRMQAPMMRPLQHANFTFAKKLSHSADSQDQHHRMVPGSRPLLVLTDQREPDYITPMLIAGNPRAREVYQRAMAEAWAAKNELLGRGVPREFALYLLPNAKAIRLIETGSLLHLLHKWTMRTCFNAQEEIYQASLEEVAQLREVHPEIARFIGPPCHLRAGIATPICTEGSHFCGVKVWLDFPNIQRRI